MIRRPLRQHSRHHERCRRRRRDRDEVSIPPHRTLVTTPPSGLKVGRKRSYLFARKRYDLRTRGLYESHQAQRTWYVIDC